MITAERFNDLTSDERLDIVEDLSAEERMQLVKELFPLFKMKCSRMGFDSEGRNKYKVTISNNGEVFSTVFYDSIYNTQRGERSDDFNILYCIISDAICITYCDSVEDFMNEFGYSYEDKPNKLYNACERAYNNLVKCFGVSGFNLLCDITYNF